MDKYCPFCKIELITNGEYNDRYEDLGCTEKEDHVFIHRIQNKNIVKAKFGIIDVDNKFLWMILDFLNNTTTIWSSDHFNNKITISQAVVIDNFTPDKLMQKIKTIMTFA